MHDTVAPVTPARHSPSSRGTVLVVDDEDGVRDLLVRWLASSGYAPVSARNATEALSKLEVEPAAVALCDIRMPGQDGLWLTARIRQRFPETAVIVSTGVQDADASVESLRQGVVDYLTKPFGRDRLRDAVARGVEWHTAAWDARCWRDTLLIEMASRKSRLEDIVRRVPVVCDTSIRDLLTVVSEHRPEHLAHVDRVAALSCATAGALDLDEEAVSLIRRGALLHEVGKFLLPDAILRKPAPLIAPEYSLVRTCPQIAADVLAAVPFLAPAADVVRSVHERIDGHGYPASLRREEIPVASRIVAAADAYDTMTHGRVYRDPISGAEALLELHRCAGTQFDAAAVAALERTLLGSTE